jgi:hypothetical protein
MVKATLAPSGIHYQGSPPSKRDMISQKTATFESHCYKNLTLHMAEEI